MSPVYKVESTIGPDHAKRFRVGVYAENVAYGFGEGSSKQRAEQEAARCALEKWAKIK